MTPRHRRLIRPWYLVAAGTGVLVLAYALTAVHGERAVDTASIDPLSIPAASYPAASYPVTSIPVTSTPALATEPGAGGWGRGGYLMMPGSAADEASLTSQNWAGYVSAGQPGRFTSVSASWAQPAVACTGTDTFASFWVGLDGDGTATVEQTGTEADCNGGNATYQGWFEMFPADPVFYGQPVQPGDAMSASVVAGGGGAFTLTLTDSTQGWTQTAHQTSGTAQLGSAEVITEAPSNGNVLPLSDFGTVSFTNATVDQAALGNENPDSLTMVSAQDVTEATPSALTGGTTFGVTWDSNGLTGSAAPIPIPTSTATAPGTGLPPRRHRHHGFGGWPPPAALRAAE